MKLLGDETDGTDADDQLALARWLVRDSILMAAFTEGLISRPQYIWAVWFDETPDN